MATGYLHTATMKVLLEFGADPEVMDRQGRSPLGLAESLRKTMPMVPEMLSRRMALENCGAMLTGAKHIVVVMRSGRCGEVWLGDGVEKKMETVSSRG